MSDQDEPKTEVRDAAAAADEATKAVPAAISPSDDAGSTPADDAGSGNDPAAEQASAAASAAAPAAAAPKVDDLPKPPTASPVAPKSHASPPPVPTGSGGVTQEKPEILVAAAFGGAFVLAQILKRIAR